MTSKNVQKYVFSGEDVLVSMVIEVSLATVNEATQVEV